MSRVILQMPPQLQCTAEEKAAQLARYLFQMAESLNVTLNSLSLDQFTEADKRELAVSASATAGAESKTRYDELKSMIIKTADAVRSEMDLLSASLSGAYVAQSDFGTYAQNASALYQATATGIEQHYSLITELQAAAQEYGEFLRNTQAYIKTGLLYEEEGIPCYGVEISQTKEGEGEVPFKVRITPEKMGFYQGNNELAYFSNNKFYVKFGEFMDSVIFRDKWEVGADADGFGIDWIE